MQSLSRSDFVTVILIQNKRRHETREPESAERIRQVPECGDQDVGEVVGGVALEGESD